MELCHHGAGYPGSGAASLWFLWRFIFLRRSPEP